LGNFLKIIEAAYFLSTLAYVKELELRINFDKRWRGLNFGTFFRKLIWGRFFVNFFPGKILRIILRKIFPQKMSGKIKIFLGKSFEKSFPQQIPQNFPRKITFRGKKCTKNRPLVTLVAYCQGRKDPTHAKK
jgi:hypothetical protein